MEKTTAEMEEARIERMKEVEVAMHMPRGDAYIIMKKHANHPLWWLEWNLLTPNTNHADRFIKTGLAPRVNWLPSAPAPHPVHRRGVDEQHCATGVHPYSG